MSDKESYEFPIQEFYSKLPGTGQLILRSDGWNEAEITTRLHIKWVIKL